MLPVGFLKSVIVAVISIVIAELLRIFVLPHSSAGAELVVGCLNKAFGEKFKALKLQQF